MSDAAIEVRGLRKVYAPGLRGALSRALTPAAGRRGAPKPRRVEALRGVDLTIRRGETVGVIGVNGAGKSTLLRHLAGLAEPTSGTVVAHGRVTAILEIATGLLPERTGRENAVYMGGLYGMAPADVEARLPAILEFAGIGRFADLPVRSYSAGMKSRLAFSIVTAIDPDILLIDEGLSVGDAGFAQRCRHRMHDLCARGSTVVLVSHNLEAIREMCARVVWIDQGRVRRDGEPGHVIEEYRAVQREHVEREIAARFGATGGGVGLRSLGADGVPRGLFHVGEPLLLEATIAAAAPLRATARLELLRMDGVVAVDTETRVELPAGTSRVVADFGAVRLGQYPYQARFRLVADDGAGVAEGRAVFAVEDPSHSYVASYHQPVAWRLAPLGARIAERAAP